MWTSGGSDDPDICCGTFVGEIVSKGPASHATRGHATVSVISLSACCRDVVSEHTFSFLDATFYSPDELKRRDMGSIPHPLVTDTLERLKVP